MGNPRQHTCVGWGIYEHESIFTTIQWKENYFHYCGGGQSHSLNPGTPLLIDTARNGFNLGERDAVVAFDIDSLGIPSLYQWVADQTDDAFLVRDVNENGVIDNGTELFGSGTLMELSGKNARNGYQALAQFDRRAALGGNSDGRITPEDTVWIDLRLWLDRNANGVTDEGEILGLDNFGIRQLSLKKRRLADRYDSAGNEFLFWSFVRANTGDESQRLVMADVVFRDILSP